MTSSRTETYRAQQRHEDAAEALRGVYGLAGPIDLAKTLMAFYEVDPAAHPEVVAELERTIGEELLDIGREVLTAHGLWIDHTVVPPASVQGAADGEAQA